MCPDRISDTPPAADRQYLYSLKTIYLQPWPQRTLFSGVLPGARSRAWSGSVPQSAIGPRLPIPPYPSNAKNLNSSVPGAVIPGNLASISSVAAVSLRDALAALALVGISPTFGTSRANPRRRGRGTQRRFKPSQMSVRSTVPRRGASPPLRGLSPVTAPAPSGAGEEAEGRAGSGCKRLSEF